jgi:hypothetical protein
VVPRDREGTLLRVGGASAGRYFSSPLKVKTRRSAGRIDRPIGAICLSLARCAGPDTRLQLYQPVLDLHSRQTWLMETRGTPIALIRSSTEPVETP